MSNKRIKKGRMIATGITPYQDKMIDALVAQGNYQTRAEFIRRAIENQLEKERKKLKLSDEEVQRVLEELREELG